MNWALALQLTAAESDSRQDKVGEGLRKQAVESGLQEALAVVDGGDDGENWYWISHY
jgi:hypothetical protein